MPHDIVISYCKVGTLSSPLNGFVSEFLIFGGLYNLCSANLISLMTIVFFLVDCQIGGMALLCFTKA
jgi:hypothetical protein